MKQKLTKPYHQPKVHIRTVTLAAIMLISSGVGLLGIHMSSADSFNSNLTWSSGAATADTGAFAKYRHAALDNVTTWPNRTNWNQISHPDIYGAVSAQSTIPRLSIGLAMLPEDGSGTFAACASGAYDSYYQTYGSEMVRLKRGTADVRLGWEANGNWYAWSIGSDFTNYIHCFRREAQAIKSTAPAIKIDWNMNKDSKLSSSVANAYPGDDVVDVIGVDFYDQYPAYPDASAWNSDFNSMQNGGPRGLGAWYNFAIAHGKKFAVPEWGLDNTDGSGDHSYFVQAMFDFFSSHATNIAYETYFNLQDQSFMILPAGVNPQGSAQYARLWGSGQAPTVQAPAVAAKPAAVTGSPAPTNTGKSTATTQPIAPASNVPTAVQTPTISAGSNSGTPPVSGSPATTLSTSTSSSSQTPPHIAVTSIKQAAATTPLIQSRSRTVEYVAVFGGWSLLSIGTVLAIIAFRHWVSRQYLHNKTAL